MEVSGQLDSPAALLQMKECNVLVGKEVGWVSLLLRTLKRWEKCLNSAGNWTPFHRSFGQHLIRVPTKLTCFLYSHWPNLKRIWKICELGSDNEVTYVLPQSHEYKLPLTDVLLLTAVSLRSNRLMYCQLLGNKTAVYIDRFYTSRTC
jgi:hypothetical protein